MSPAPDLARSAPAVGDVAPDFSLTDQRGEVITLSTAVADRPALVVFFPWAFSSICMGELLEIQLNIDRFVNDKVQVLAVSCDSSTALRSWAAQEGYRFPLLSDFWPHGQVAQSYGVFDEELGVALRGTFVVGSDGLVGWSLVRGPGEQRDIGELHAAVRDL